LLGTVARNSSPRKLINWASELAHVRRDVIFHPPRSRRCGDAHRSRACANSDVDPVADEDEPDLRPVAAGAQHQEPCRTLDVPIAPAYITVNGAATCTLSSGSGGRGERGFVRQFKTQWIGLIRVGIAVRQHLLDTRRITR
jgi:hypothetical protein